MIDLALSANVMADYLDNVVRSKGFRELARASRVPPSTPLRRARRCEDLRDHPEWDALFSALEVFWAKAETPKMNASAVLAALHLTKSGLEHNIQERRRSLMAPDATIVTSDEFPSAVILDRDGCRAGTLDRAHVLAALAFGWVTPIGETSGRVRRFAVTKKIPLERALTTSRGRVRYHRERPLEGMFRRKGNPFDPARKQAARDFEILYAQGTDSPEYQAIQSALPPSLLRPLEAICAGDMGVEDFEKQEGWPTRSGKAILAVALDTFRLHVATQ